MTRTNIRDTSLLAHDALGPKISRQQQVIIDFMCRHPRDITRGELAALTGIALSAICGRVNELVKRGDIVEGERRKCRMTGSSAHPLTLKPIQYSLIGDEQRAA